MKGRALFRAVAPRLERAHRERLVEMRREAVEPDHEIVRQFAASRGRSVARHNSDVIARGARRQRVKDSVLTVGGAVVVVALLSYLNFLFG